MRALYKTHWKIDTRPTSSICREVFATARACQSESMSCTVQRCITSLSSPDVIVGVLQPAVLVVLEGLVDLILRTGSVHTCHYFVKSRQWPGWHQHDRPLTAANRCLLLSDKQQGHASTLRCACSTRQGAWAVRAWVFMTKGPCCTMGSPMGRPAASRKRMPEGASLLATTLSPGPSTSA